MSGVGVSVAPEANAEVLAQLRAHVARAEARFRPQPFPVVSALEGVLPESGLMPGTVYSLSVGGALLQSLLSGPSAKGHWCGVIGVSDFATEAAEIAGVRLDRLVLVPEPGNQWLAVVAALADVLEVLVIRPPGSVRAKDAARLAARLRDRGGVLLVVGDWPRADVRLSLASSRWQGLGCGHGYLMSREVEIEVSSKRYPQPRRRTVLLPDRHGRIARKEVAPVTQLRAVG